MNVQTFNGYEDGGRTSSKVLRPPGGGSSDIFGLNDPVSAPEPAKPVAEAPAAPAPTVEAPVAPADVAPASAAPADVAPAPEPVVPEPAAPAQEAPAESAPEPAAASLPPIGADEIGGSTAIAGSGNQDRTRIDANGRIMSAPAFKANRVPPGGHSSGPLW